MSILAIFIKIIVWGFIIFSIIGVLSYAFEKPKPKAKNNNRTINITVNINIEEDDKSRKASDNKLLEDEKKQ
ncbi:MAG: hypothetical protein IIW55_01625 [Bacteroidales bacterium]|jgi:hypothetical protein|nr:hypothetical protein [Bacteroidales bacterium]MBO7287414.1 hypothetical protein [Bacteroidales bacterium]MBQ5688972.1 hypothetical protein [Bacteroidales bacterium]MBQ5855990.1 hypothetical protein [Bacteroidales bacterium]MBR0323491.1 hypothetical protein [Bacteroidales bacterium]